MRPTLLVGMLAALLLAAPVPVASAHDCEAENPEVQCGPCPNGTHVHRYNDGRIHCQSNDGSILCLAFLGCIP